MTREMNLNLPEGAPDTRELLARINGLIRDGYPEDQVVAAGLRGLIEVVGRLEASLGAVEASRG